MSFKTDNLSDQLANQKAPPVTKRYYLATHFPQRQMANLIVDMINTFKFKSGVLARSRSLWLNPKLDLGNMRDAAQVDISEVCAADFLVALAPLGYGSTAEMATAIALKKPVVMLVDPTQFDYDTNTNLIENMLVSKDDYIQQVQAGSSEDPPLLYAHADNFMDCIDLVLRYLTR